MVLLGLAVLTARRRHALIPILVMACFIATAQRIVFATLDFSLLRLMIAFGWARVLLYSETRGFRWKPTDVVVLLWCLSATTIVTLREARLDALIYRLGLSFDAIGMYFLARLLIRDWRDVEALARAAALLSLPVAVAFTVEFVTARNMFSIFGGVPELTTVRFGRLRCSGPFPHPILAGCFWGSLIPLIGALWWRGGAGRPLAIAGVGAAIVIVLATGSATPLMAVNAAVVGMLLFPLRRHMQVVRFGLLFTLVQLHFAMVNPVWHLLARMNPVEGATGWYRFKLIDGFLRNTQEWWLVGSRAYERIWDHAADAVTNQYVLEGLEGGLVTLLFFLLVITLGFASAGRAVRSAGRDRFRQMLAWALGVALFTHSVDFIAVSYFGQIVVLWHVGLAAAVSLAPPRSLPLGARACLRTLVAAPADVASTDRSPLPIPDPGLRLARYEP